MPGQQRHKISLGQFVPVSKQIFQDKNCMKQNRGYSERTSTDQNYNDGKITGSMNIHESKMLVFETESLRGK